MMQTANEIRIAMLNFQKEDAPHLYTEKEGLRLCKIALLQLEEDYEMEWQDFDTGTVYPTNDRAKLDKERKKLLSLRSELEKATNESEILSTGAEQTKQPVFFRAWDNAKCKTSAEIIAKTYRKEMSKLEAIKELELSKHIVEGYLFDTKSAYDEFDTWNIEHTTDEANNELARIEIALSKINSDEEQVKTDPATEGVALTDPASVKPNPAGKIVWKWGKSDLAWLYDSLILQHAIDCNEATFAAAFITKDMEAMPSALSDYRKSPRPGRQAMKTIQDAISTHKPEETRN